MTRRDSEFAVPAGGRHRTPVFEEPRTDPYAAKGHYRSPTRCMGCGAVYLRGRWQWAAGHEDAPSKDCPACRRAAEGLPAGWLRIEGDFAREHRSELVSTIRNEAARERSEHPLNRMLTLEETHDGIEVATADIHLPQRLGEALKSAYQGDLDVRYGANEYSVRVTWRR